ncbi:DUF397 domain-containing protein [Saccharopolyspora griseoalba]|uniref:DUF397 domain-containing protein n=1 Tax=Saccharopolyspora griseoalba TaxID=1431848 RepID=A0ABW2LRR9_9PSEU
MDDQQLDVLRDVEFRKSSFSAQQGNCVEVGFAADGGRWLRDSKDRSKPAHYFTPAEWEAFLLGVRNGEFDTH